MGDGNGAGGLGNRVECRAFARMTHIHHQPHAVHLGHHFAAHAGQAGILGLITARGEKRLIVIGQLHEAQAQPVQHLDKTDIILNAGRVLRAEKDRGAPGLAGEIYVLGGKALKDQVGEAFEPAIPAFDIQHRLAKSLVIGDGHMHRIDTARAHLAENLLRPVGILQRVDAWGHAGAPEWI